MKISIDTKKIKHYIKEVLIFILVMTIFANLLSIYKSGDLNKDKLNIEFISLLKENSINLDSDKAILIHFWATWCPTCNLEASNIQMVSKKYQVVTIAVKSDKEDINRYFKDNNLNFNVINDSNGFLAREFNIAAYPTTFIYDKNKNLVFSEVGYTSTLGLYLRMWWANL